MLTAVHVPLEILSPSTDEGTFVRIGDEGRRFTACEGHLETAPTRIRATSSGASNEEKWPVLGSVIR